MTLFDWMPSIDTTEGKVAWGILVGICVVVAAVLVFDPCQTNVFAGMAGNNCP
jgi:hypothetical protein